MGSHIRSLAIAALLAGAALPAAAQEVGVAVSNFDDNFLTLLRQAMSDNAAEHSGMSLQFEDAQRDVGRQLSQIENFVATGVKGIIIAPVDSDSTVPMTVAAQNAGIPVVYVNNRPVNLDQLPDNQVFVGSDETEAGTLEAKEVCRLLKEAGKTEATAVILLGDLSNQATRLRTQAVKDVFATTDCSFIKITDEQTATWQRTQAADLMTNWLTAGVKPDAVIANNDEMAIGAYQALKAAGVPMDSIIVAGVDATPDALQAIAAGDMDVTVLQSAPGQGKGAIDAIGSLISGEKVERENYVPFELVTKDNYKNYLPK
ncbi:MAG: sugar ABC transporter substrate-binding protein [Amaricoccus sp.]|uniref:sugar ABC transporter substrate-binding protein n=1 Tax=Amaricoccus sp. TaxID=1872485 RepID=UPI0039E4721B